MATDFRPEFEHGADIVVLHGRKVDGMCLRTEASANVRVHKDERGIGEFWMFFVTLIYRL